MAHFTTSDGVRIYYESHGTGEPLLLAYGIGEAWTTASTRSTDDFTTSMGRARPRPEGPVLSGS